MADDRFTKDEGKNAKWALGEMYDAIPKKKQLDFIGHLNDIALFIEAAIRHAPEKKRAPEE